MGTLSTLFQVYFRIQGQLNKFLLDFSKAFDKIIVSEVSDLPRGYAAVLLDFSNAFDNLTNSLEAIILQRQNGYSSYFVSGLV